MIDANQPQGYAITDHGNQAISLTVFLEELIEKYKHEALYYAHERESETDPVRKHLLGKIAITATKCVYDLRKALALSMQTTSAPLSGDQK